MPLLLAHLTFSALSLKMTSIHTAHRNRKVCNYYMKRNRAENGWSWSWSWSWSGSWSWSYSNTTSMDAAIDFKKQLQVPFSFSFFLARLMLFVVAVGSWGSLIGPHSTGLLQMQLTAGRHYYFPCIEAPTAVYLQSALF